MRLVLVLLDGEQQIALLDDRAILEMDFFEIAGHAGDEHDLGDRLGVAGGRQGLVDGLYLGEDDGNRRRVRWRRRCRLGGLRAVRATRELTV